jgi:hypothetical protein
MLSKNVIFLARLVVNDKVIHNKGFLAEDVCMNMADL